MDIEDIVKHYFECTGSCTTCNGRSHRHFDAKQNISMLCAFDVATGSCLWCVAASMHSDVLPMMYQEYVDKIRAFITQRSRRESEAIWSSYVQKQIQDLMAVNVKPAKRNA